MHRKVTKLARFMAVLGGLVLVALILLTGVSVAGRVLNTVLHGSFMQGLAPDLAGRLIALGIGPVNGDYELVEAGMAFAVFAFLPLCQITGSHAYVDVFTAWLPPRASRMLRAVIEVAFALVLVVIAVQLHEGLQSKLRSGQSSLLLQTPVWWNYAASLSGAVIAALAGSYMAIVRVLESVSGRVILAEGPEAGH